MHSIGANAVEKLADNQKKCRNIGSFAHFAHRCEQTQMQSALAGRKILCARSQINENLHQNFHRPACGPDIFVESRRVLRRLINFLRCLASCVTRPNLNSKEWVMSSKPASCDFETGKLVLRLNITVQANLEAISPVVDGVMATVREMKCAAGHEFEIETALREALANAIKHGCKNDSSKQVQCCVACDDTRGMLIVVRDPGGGFDPASIPSPVIGENIYSAHGRGIYLINQLMDKVEIRHGGTEIVMRKH